MTFNNSEENNSLLQDILTIDAKENGRDVTLLEMYRDLLDIGERLKGGILRAVEEDARMRAEKGEDEEEEEEEDEPDESNDDSEDDDDDDDEESPKSKNNKAKTKKLSDIAQLMEALSLGQKQKQHLMIKKAILLKFEEALFGNNSITMTLDLRHVGEDGDKEGRLEKLLQCRDLTKYIPKQESTESGISMEFAEKARLQECINVATNPTDILSVLRPKTPKKIATNLIKQQYNLRWNTKSGEAAPFDFYKLEKHFRKGSVRKAYIQTLLYEHKVVLENFRARLKKDAIEAADFAPKFVYGKRDPYAAKQASGDDEGPPQIRPRDEPKFVWQKWAVMGQDRQDLSSEFPQELKWIEPKVRTLLRKICEPLEDTFSPHETENAMYIIVLKETTSASLSEIGNQSQIYIGGADNGVTKRFLDGDDSHCSQIKKCFDQISQMESFTPIATSLLIELRLLLAFTRQEPFAVFAVKSFDQPRTLGREVHDLITKALYLDKDEIWGPALNMNFGLNMKEEMKKRRKFLPDHFPGSKRKQKR